MDELLGREDLNKVASKQAEYYLLHQSHCTAWAWAEGLVSNLFAITHKMWTLQNGVVHTRDEKGLKVKEGEELWEVIAEQFELGTIGLLSADRHYIAWGRNVVEAMMAAEQKTWLHGICIACKVGEHEEESEVAQLWDAMLWWLSTA